MRLLGLKNCDTCRAALKELPANTDFQDVRVSPISEEKLCSLLAQFGDALVNKRSTTWRGLDETQRMRDPVALLLENPTLMKRPVIETGSDTYLGWGADVKAAVLGK